MDSQIRRIRKFAAGKEGIVDITIEALTDKLETLNFDTYAIRVIPVGTVAEGDELANSHEWLDGVEGEELAGTCGIDVEWDGWEMGCFDKAMELTDNYNDGTQQIVVIGGTRDIDDIYNDIGEVIVHDAVVVHVFS